MAARSGDSKVGLAWVSVFEIAVQATVAAAGRESGRIKRDEIGDERRGMDTRMGSTGNAEMNTYGC